MYLSECCGASFPEPGYPDTDLCGQCHEHTGAYKDPYDEDDDVQLGASIVKSNDNVSGVFMVDGKIKDVDYFDSEGNINIQQVIDRLNNLELIGRNKKELCEIVDILSDIQKQIYEMGLALNQTTKE